MSPALRPPPLRRRAPNDLEALGRFFHGLADPSRVRILELLLNGPKTAGEIVRHLGQPQSNVSAHLGCLRHCGYAHARRDGRNVIYEIVDDRIRDILVMGELYLAENAERIMACHVIAPAGGVTDI